MANFYGLDGNDSTVGDFVEYYGGHGNDRLRGDALPNELYGGQGKDWLAGAQFTTFTGTGTAADPYVITGFQPSGADVLEGGSGSDILHGADGDDEIYGGSGDEAGPVAVSDANSQFVEAGLYGGDGDDRLYGGTGDDDLTGGLGQDQHWGGDDADTFIFAAIAETAKKVSLADVIHDFNRKQNDLIDLSGIDAKPGGSDNAFKYIGENDFTGKKGQLRYEKLKLRGDINGDGKADFTIKLDGVARLAAGDIEL